MPVKRQGSTLSTTEGALHIVRIHAGHLLPGSSDNLLEYADKQHLDFWH